tara:strand:+ start:873 stop:2375 length:1503 start_codon:yes stop_codon:yes gene_type:complete
MSIESVHTQYEENVEGWKTVIDCIAGGRTIKKLGETYLPRLDGQTDKEYQKFKQRGNFFNGTSTANRAQTGLLTRKPPETETELDAQVLADIDMQGNTITNYCVELAEAVSSTGRACTIIEWSEEEQRPYFAFYREVDILDWHTTRTRGKNVLDYLKVRERDDEMKGDDVSTANTERIRIYRIRDGILTVDVYSDRNKTSQYTGSGVETYLGKGITSSMEAEETFEPMRGGKNMTFIPVVFHGATHTKPDVGEIPLEDLAQINVSHYISSVDLEHARHIAALPTPYATGIDAENGTFKLGTEYAWISENDNAKFGFLEFTGSGLSELTKALEEKQQQMSALGARLLFAESRDAEAFETVQLRASADTASLSRMSSAMSASLSRAMQIAAWWSDKTSSKKPKDYSETNFIVVSQDFVSAGMNPQTLTALVSALQMGAISYPTFFYNLQKGEMYPEGTTADEEKRDLEQESPMPTPAPEPEPAPQLSEEQEEPEEEQDEVEA